MLYYLALLYHLAHLVPQCKNSINNGGTAEATIHVTLVVGSRCVKFRNIEPKKTTKLYHITGNYYSLVSPEIVNRVTL
jgi:hypothetical protein